MYSTLDLKLILRLAILGVGFMQSLYALDAADGESGGGVQVFNSLVQALLG
jgi:hypothetical protein